MDYTKELIDPETIPVCIYKDTTGMYTEAECDKNNCLEYEVPRDLLKEWFSETVYPESYSGEDVNEALYQWVWEDSTADETDSLLTWLHKHGHLFRRPDARFWCNISDEVRVALARGKSYPNRHDWGLAGLEIGNVSLEVNLTSDDEEYADKEGFAAFSAEYFLCIRDKDHDWMSAGYVDGLFVDINWADENWKAELEADLYWAFVQILSGRVAVNGQYHNVDPHDELSAADFDCPCAGVYNADLPEKPAEETHEELYGYEVTYELVYRIPATDSVDALEKFHALTKGNTLGANEADLFVGGNYVANLVNYKGMI